MIYIYYSLIVFRTSIERHSTKHIRILLIRFETYEQYDDR